MNKETDICPETQMLAYFFQTDIFSYVRSFVDAKAFLISWDVNEEQRNNNSQCFPKLKFLK